MPSTISAGTTAGTAIAVAGDTTGNLAFQTNGTTTAMTIDTSQNVGIGTASPAAKLDIVTSSANSARLLLTSDANGQAGIQAVNSTNTGTIALGLNVGGGNVGIGTSSPSFRLSINGGGSTAKINTLDTFDGGASLSTWMKVGRRAGTGNNAYVNTQHSGSDAVDGLAFAFGTSGTGSESMRIVAAGGVRVACENYAAQPSSTNFGVEINNTNSGSSFFGQGTGTESHLIFGNRNGVRGSIQTNATNTVYNTSSDYRLKENVAPMIDALAKVQQLKPCTYTWKVDGSDGQGFIAHELQTVVPDCVTGDKDAVDENGEPKYQMVDTSFLVATLTAAIQELNAKVEAQAAEIAALKGA